jgi:ribosomal-protein-alanine N-acetyltransferase
MNKTDSIRPYASSDKEAVLELIRLNTPAFFASEELEELNYYLENQREEYFVVEVDGKIVGSGGINYSKDKTIGFLSWDAILPDFQRKSLGSKLVQFRLEILNKSEKIEAVKVRTSQFAYTFYKKHGFRLMEVVEDHWSEGYDLYELEIIKQHTKK